MDALLREQIIGPQGPLKGETLKSVHSISGGCIHDAWKLKLMNGQTFFAKTNSLDSYEILSFEFVGLQTLNSYTDNDLLLIPKPSHIQKLESAAILLMPWINMQINHEKKLGQGLAMMHKSSIKQGNTLFGWGKDGFIGSGTQPSGFKNNWGECFVDLRLIPQLKIAEKWGLNLNHYSILLKKLTNFLNCHEPSSSIVHGDLWKGNAGISEDGRGVIFDPAVWWADREVDIAMTKLFGGFSKDFYDAYEETWPLPESAIKRENIYNLYHVLNHANIFGGSYKDQSLSILEKLKKTFIN